MPMESRWKIAGSVYQKTLACEAVHRPLLGTYLGVQGDRNGSKPEIRTDPLPALTLPLTFIRAGLEPGR